MDSIAITILLAISALLGVPDLPGVAQLDWKATPWQQIDHFYEMTASSKEVLDQCRANPEHFLAFPMIVQAVHVLSVDGREFFRSGDPKFQTVGTFFGAPNIHCKEIPAGTELSWHVVSFTKYFARIQTFPELRNSRPLFNLFAEGLSILGVGCSLMMALMVATMFWGKLSRSLIGAIVTSLVFSIFYFSISVSRFLSLPFDMITSHKIADTGIWLSMAAIIFAFYKVGLMPKRYYAIYFVNIIAGIVFLCMGSGGDTIQLGTTLPFAATFTVMAILLFSAIKKLKRPMGRQAIFSVLSLGTFVAACANEMLVVFGLVPTPPLLPFGYCSGVFFFTLMVRESIEQTYRERDHLKANLELEAIKKTQELSAKSKALTETNLTLDSMLNSLGQGFLTFDRSGICNRIFSRACIDLFEAAPAGKKFAEVLRLPQEQLASFNSWVAMSFEDDDRFSLIKSAGPKTYPHSQNRYIELDYHQLKSAGNEIGEIVVVATDKTEEMAARRTAEAERVTSIRIATIVKRKALFRSFMNEYRRNFDQFSAMAESGRMHPEAPVEFKRFLHTMKGSASFFFITDVSSLIHRQEDELKNLGPQAAMDPRLVSQHLKELNEKMQAFIQANADILGPEFRSQRILELSLPKFENLVRSREFSEAPSKLLESILSISEVPVQSYFDHYASLVKNLAEKQTKKIEHLRIKNGDIPVFPESYGDFFSTFIHVFRNIVDHGLEKPSDRVAAGKAAGGQIEVSFKVETTTESGKDCKNLLITVADDGRGIDPNMIRSKLASKGLHGRAEGKTDEEVIQEIFSPDFSSKDVATELSGRGIGLDALKSAAITLGGKVVVHSTLGIGTEITVQVPLKSAFEYYSTHSETQASAA